MKKSRRTRLTGHVARKGDMRDAYGVFVRRNEGKIPLEDQRKLEDNMKMDIQEMGWGRMDWTDLARVEVGGGHW